MLRGDIDLTENLDFRKDKPLPKMLPAVLSKNQLPSSNFISNYNNSITTVNEYSIIEYLEFNNIRFHEVTSDDDLMTYSFEDIDTYNTTTTSSYTFSYNPRRYWQSSSYYPSDYYYTYEKLKSYDVKQVSSPFGKTRKIPKYKPNKCQLCGTKIAFINNSYCSECIDKDKSYELSKNHNKAKKSLFKEKVDYEEYTTVPWDNNGNSAMVMRLNKLKQMSENRRGKKGRIPWLSNLSGFRYDDYINELYEDIDYSDKYLDNLAWLRLS